jgi:pimeloyl-ACP methyl ester carboxylesterase
MCAGLALVDGGLTDFQDLPGATWDTIKRDLSPPDLSRYTISDMVSWMGKGVLSTLPRSFLEDYAHSIMAIQPDGTIRARLTLNRHLDILRIIYNMRTPELFARAQCPLLAIQAVDGEPASGREAAFLRMKKQGAERAHKLAPHARIVWLNDTIHDIPLHRPQALAQEIVAHFKGCATASSGLSGNRSSGAT